MIPPQALPNPTALREPCACTVRAIARSAAPPCRTETRGVRLPRLATVIGAVLALSIAAGALATCAGPRGPNRPSFAWSTP